jgi:hypothetical protein
VNDEGFLIYPFQASSFEHQASSFKNAQVAGASVKK